MATLITRPLAAVLRQRVTARLVADQAKTGNHIDPPIAERALDDCLEMLALMDAGEIGAPRTVLEDEAWHTLLLYSRHYTDYCTGAFGRVIHHEPHDEPGRCDVDIDSQGAAKCSNDCGWDPRCGEDREPAARPCGNAPMPKCGRCKVTCGRPMTGP